MPQMKTNAAANPLRNIVAVELLSGPLSEVEKADLSACQFPSKSLKKFGSPGRIRTSDQPVNSRLGIRFMALHTGALRF